jgi:ribose transport system permease protein
VKKILGILGLLVAVCLLTALASDRFLSADNLQNVARRSALFGIISIGAGFVIITSGIDLSIGSMICLVGCLLPWLLVDQGWSPWLAMPMLLVGSVLVGLAHGLLITKLKLQPFVVTLCGLLLYRGATRGILRDQAPGFLGQYEGLRWLAQGAIPLPGTDFDLPMPCVILAVVALLSAVFLNMTVHGRYLRALGRNEEAARYSGIDTDRMIILAYVLCSLLAGLGGMLFVMDVGSAQPVDFGSFYELYAIAAAVLGGCSLRGGEGSILGIIIGAAVMQVLRNAIILIEAISNKIEFAVIGLVILAGVVADEAVKRAIARHRRASEAP